MPVPWWFCRPDIHDMLSQWHPERKLEYFSQNARWCSLGSRCWVLRRSSGDAKRNGPRQLRLRFLLPHQSQRLPRSSRLPVSAWMRQGRPFVG